MFTKYQAIFRSRWRALLWSAGVLLTAYCSVPSPDDDGDDLADLAKLAGVQQQGAEPAKHVNPWALKK